MSISVVSGLCFSVRVCTYVCVCVLISVRVSKRYLNKMNVKVNNVYDERKDRLLLLKSL